MDLLEATQEVDIDHIEADREMYTLQITVHRDRFEEWLNLFRMMSALTGRLEYQTIRAKQSMRWRENHQEMIEKRDKEIRDKIRVRFEVLFSELQNERAALKIITQEFKEWWWIRDKFEKEIRTKRDLEIIRLHNQGLTSKKIAVKLGLHPGTVRKILSKERI